MFLLLKTYWELQEALLTDSNAYNLWVFITCVQLIDELCGIYQLAFREMVLCPVGQLRTIVSAENL